MKYEEYLFIFECIMQENEFLKKGSDLFAAKGMGKRKFLGGNSM
jgi:hypothetical protein